MVLAGLLRDHPSELRADFQQTYNLNLDSMGEEYTFLHAADLTTQLPSNSRTFVALNPDNLWTLEAQLLAIIEFRIHVIEYRLRRGKGEKPKPLFAHKKQSKEIEPMPIDEVKDFLNRSRT